ncbi:MAG: hypothetical protein WAT92_00230 [Saprospiraceae bacterium]
MKAYLSKLMDIELPSLPKHKFNVNRISEFMGLIFDCETLEPYNHEINVSHNKVINIGITHRYQIKINEADYIFFNRHIGYNFMVWLVSDDFVYICPDEYNGFYCTVEIHTSDIAFLKIRMRNYPNRIPKPKQFYTEYDNPQSC